MKKLLLTIFFFSIGWIVFSTPVHAIVCDADHIGQCGPSAGCNNTEACSYNLSGGISCGYASNCPTAPNPCTNDSVTDCTRLVNVNPTGLSEYNISVGVDAGTACSTAGQTCQHQGGITNPNKCVCLATSTPSVIPTSGPSITPTPTPTIEPLSVNGTVCPNNGTVYPPNSTCYNPAGPKAEAVAANLTSVTDSNSSILAYPLTCVSAPTITYSQTYTDNLPTGVRYGLLDPWQLYADVSVKSDVSNAELGFLGPDSTTLATSNPDSLAKTYLFNALFDRPATDPDASRESFRTFWRMLDSLSQAQLKAYYIQNVNDFTYYYVGADYKQHEVKIEDLRKALPSCLKSFADKDCWVNGGTGDTKYYLNDYLSLNSTIRDEYDALLPFDFNNMRGYLSNGTTISKENIPYLRAILTGLKGYREDVTTSYYIPGIGLVKIPNTVVPGLFDYYTPSWADEPLALYPTVSNEDLSLIQYPVIRIASLLNNSCVTPTSSSSVTSPKTYTDPTDLSQTVSVPVTSTLISSTPDHYECSVANNINGFKCVLVKGTNTYSISGSTVGKPITVFNNPYITSLTDLVTGGKPLVSNTSNYGFVQTIIDAINKLSDKLVSPVQPSFYKMLLPDFASESAKTYVSAPSVSTSTDNTYASVQGSSTIYRENNLAQDSMFLLQNCWLVPSDQQSTSKCGLSSETTTPFVCSANCEKKIPDATTTLTYKDKFIDLVNRWVGAGTPATDKIETVINSSIAAGVNPIFTLAIWLHESDASNYDGICNKLGGGSGSSTYCTHLLDFGVNKNAIASNYITQQFYFNEQLNSFLNLPGYYKDVCKTEMAASECPMRIFMAMFDLGQCTPTDETDNYMKSIMSIYKTIAPSENYPCYPSTYP